ncbi:Hypothetical predicted protein [Olea europaea subsp. europaea]|uniref:Uncharacterized protein n=1 Tax=Olea europaea subsp. europaea TaxID=158383 RepID=A0A8S0Q982_OLEEU|nr:Hypothetical predicted protein [Olea europaea subsp. europaea]
MEGPNPDMEDDSDFSDSDKNILSGEDDLLFEKNETEGVELGYDVGATECNEDGHAATMHDEDHEFDDLECPSSEELLSDYGLLTGFDGIPSLGKIGARLRDEGPAASIPFSEIGPSSHTQEIIEQMNFEELDEQNNASSRSRAARADARRLARTATH